jgi:hypothetical protein
MFLYRLLRVSVSVRPGSRPCIVGTDQQNVGTVSQTVRPGSGPYTKKGTVPLVSGYNLNSSNCLEESTGYPVS